MEILTFQIILHMKIVLLHQFYNSPYKNSSHPTLARTLRSVWTILFQGQNIFSFDYDWKFSKSILFSCYILDIWYLCCRALLLLFSHLIGTLLCCHLSTEHMVKKPQYCYHILDSNIFVRKGFLKLYFVSEGWLYCQYVFVNIDSKYSDIFHNTSWRLHLKIEL